MGEMYRCYHIGRPGRLLFRYDDCQYAIIDYESKDGLLTEACCPRMPVMRGLLQESLVGGRA